MRVALLGLLGSMTRVRGGYMTPISRIDFESLVLDLGLPDNQTTLQVIGAVRVAIDQGLEEEVLSNQIVVFPFPESSDTDSEVDSQADTEDSDGFPWQGEKESWLLGLICDLYGFDVAGDALYLKTCFEQVMGSLRTAIDRMRGREIKTVSADEEEENDEEGENDF